MVVWKEESQALVTRIMGITDVINWVLVIVGTGFDAVAITWSLPPSSPWAGSQAHRNRRKMRAQLPVRTVNNAGTLATRISRVSTSKVSLKLEKRVVHVLV